jgi:hypothetical protein
VVAVAVALAAACGTASDTEPEPPRELGQEIVVTGAVDRRIDATGFVLQAEDGADGLLVVAPLQPVDPADVVEVQGLVQRFERRAVEAELHRPLDPGHYGRFEGLDFLRAERVVIRS